MLPPICGDGGVLRQDDDLRLMRFQDKTTLHTHARCQMGEALIRSIVGNHGGLQS